MAQSLLLFSSNKHKKCEMQKQKDIDNINVKCRYYNQAPKSQLVKVNTSANNTPKFQLVKVSTGVGIATKPQIPVGRGKYKFGYFKLK